MADIKNINGKNIKDAAARNDIADLKINSHSHTNKTILDTITQEKINSWNTDKTTFNDFTVEQTATEKILKFKGIEIFRCSLQVPGSSGVTTYTVTKNLTNCKTSNNATSINSGSAYTTTITANSGYTVNTITVTMGGVNVTNSVVSSANISISNVTGNIVITASAVTTTNYNVTRNLSNCSCSNSTSSIESGSSYSATIIANDGYTMSSITVTMGGVDVTSTVVSGNRISISNVTGNIVITASATKINYSITRNLSNCSCSNSASNITSGSSYLATITANSGCEISSITVTIGEVDVTSTVVSGNSINISSVTGDVIVTAVAISNINNDIAILGNNISIPGGRGTINSYENGTLEINTTNGDRVAFIINNLNLKDNSVYKLSCSFDQENSTCFESINSGEVYTGGIKFQKTDITNYNDISFTFNTYNWSTASNPSISCAIHGTSLLGIGIFKNMKITKIGELEKYTITNELTNVTNNNNLTEIVENQKYTATITANSGYVVDTITVTMDGTDITSQVVSGNSINIANVTGNIVITATASITTSTTTYTVTNNLTNCSNNNSNTTVNANYSYLATISVNSGYAMSSITVTMGGVNVTSQVVSGNSINIPSVTGNVVITATANSKENDSGYNPMGDVSKLSYDVTTVPQITHFYYPGKQKVSSNETIIPIYFSDYYQREYYYEDTSLRFNLRIDVDGNVRWIDNLPAGDHDISLGVLPVGEHRFSFEVTQVGTNLKSQRLFNKVWIVDNTNDITASQTYNVTSNDLSKHNITLGLTSSATKEQMSNNRNGMREMLAEIHDKGYRKIILPANSIIRVNATENDTRDPKKIGGDRWAFQRCIVIPTNTTVDLNGSTIKLHPYDDREFGDVGRVYNYMVTFTDCVDSHLINGTIEGDYFERQSATFYTDTETGKTSNGLDHANGEHCSCIAINGGRYNSIDNLTIKQITGYNCQCERTMKELPTVNMCYHWGENLGCWLNGNNKDIINGVETTVAEERCTSDFVDISKLLPYKAFSSGKMLSDYPSGGYYEVLLSFYDENKNFIESFVGYQAREADIPANSKYLRITINGKHTDLSAEPDFFLMHPLYAEYTEWNNIEFVDNRTCCNPNRFKHLRVYNCNFTRSGQSITPIALDAEDGGATMQDIFIENCSIKEYAPTQSGDAICVGGLNVVIQNNNNLSWGIRAQVIGATIRNNVGGRTSCGIEKGWRTRNTVRCYNNEFKGFDTKGVPSHLSMGFAGEFDKKDALLMIKGCKVVNHDNSGWVTNDLLRQNLIFKDCDDVQMGAFTRHINNTIYINSTNTDAAWRTGRSTFYNCTFTRKTTGGSDRHEILSYNYGKNVDDIGTYDNCVFNFPGTTVTVFGDLENAFIKGEFNNCTFKTPMIFKLLYANNMGDIKFNNCKFEAELTLNLRDTKVQFNGCTFNGITYLNNGQANSQFN